MENNKKMNPEAIQALCFKGPLWKSIGKWTLKSAFHEEPAVKVNNFKKLKKLKKRKARKPPEGGLHPLESLVESHLETVLFDPFSESPAENPLGKLLENPFER